MKAATDEDFSVRSLERWRGGELARSLLGPHDALNRKPAEIRLRLGVITNAVCLDLNKEVRLNF